MKKIAVISIAVLALALLVTAAVAEEEQSWFDLENCAMCSKLGAEEGLMDHIDWETHKIANGMLTVSMVPAEYAEAFARASAKMQEVAAELHSGKPLKLCGFCMSYGAIAQAGANVEEIETGVGHIGLVTSDKPEVVKMIHAHAKRTMDEYEKWKADQDAGHAAGDPSHDHGS